VTINLFNIITYLRMDILNTQFWWEENTNNINKHNNNKIEWLDLSYKVLVHKKKKFCTYIKSIFF